LDLNGDNKVSLINKLKQDQLEARKKAIKEPVPHKAKASLLTTLIGEASIIGKNDGDRESTDVEVLAVIKKFIKNIDELLASSDQVNTLALMEKQILSQYLPQQLSDSELVSAITEIASNIGAATMKDMGAIMKGLQAAHNGKFDGKVASQKVREYLQGLSK